MAGAKVSVPCCYGDHVVYALEPMLLARKSTVVISTETNRIESLKNLTFFNIIFQDVLRYFPECNAFCK